MKTTNGHTAAEANGRDAAAAPGKPKASRKKPRSSRKTAVRKTTPAEWVSDDAIRLRAYFLSESRARMSLPGDAAADWIEARRQLLAESGGKK